MHRPGRIPEDSKGENKRLTHCTKRKGDESDTYSSVQFSSVAQLCPTLRPHESQHTRPPCSSPTPGVYSNSCPSSRWCHPAISSSVPHFSSCPQSLPASGSFPMSQLFTWGGQKIGVSASASVLPMNTQDWSPLGWTGCISLQSRGLSSLLQHHSSKASIFRCSVFFTVQISHLYMTTGKTIALTRQTFVGKLGSFKGIVLQKGSENLYACCCRASVRKSAHLHKALEDREQIDKKPKLKTKQPFPLRKTVTQRETSLELGVWIVAAGRGMTIPS